MYGTNIAKLYGHDPDDVWTWPWDEVLQLIMMHQHTTRGVGR